MHNQTSVQFKVSKVRYVEPGNANPSDDPDKGSTSRNILSAVCIVIGAVATVEGIYRRDLFFIVCGAGFIVFGLLVSDCLWDAIPWRVGL